VEALVEAHMADLCAVAAFLASDLASYVTGTALSVDGGLHRSIL
jgi:NAD(P)-dependent dehydrogenase (short-subunit alcohol dehydrogenase family)